MSRAGREPLSYELDHRELRRTSFDDPGVAQILESVTVAGDEHRLDELPFGVVVMNRSCTVQYYNSNESARSGLRPSRVLGRNFFEQVGPCTNNFLVAERFHEAATGSAALDETIDYVFTFVMRPTPVRLRLVAAAGSGRQYLLVCDR